MRKLDGENSTETLISLLHSISVLHIPNGTGGELSLVVPCGRHDLESPTPPNLAFIYKPRENQQLKLVGLLKESDAVVDDG